LSVLLSNIISAPPAAIAGTMGMIRALGGLKDTLVIIGFLQK
jgi:hypothetical protein